VFQDTITNLIILADVKTAMPKQFQIQKNRDSLPKENHRIQVTAYGYGLTKLDIRFDLLAIMYFDRAGSNKPLIYFVEPYKDIEDLFNQYILAVLRYEQDKILPPRLDDILDKSQAWECGYCDFNNISCEGLMKGEKV